MSAIIVSRTDKKFKIEVEIPYNRNMLDGEECLQKCLNMAGALGTKELLEQFDTDGSPIIFGSTKLTAKGEKETKEFQTPYGEVEISRFVYQTSKGGKTYIPLDTNSKIINSSTPKFSKMISSKYASDGAPGVQRDLEENHNRSVSLSFIKNISDAVGAIAVAKEEDWSYQLPSMPKKVASISIGVDGTCLNMIDDGWREAMCGTIALFDAKGERMHTIYTGASPEYGKETFFKKMDNAINDIKKIFPNTPVIGLADGAASNWGFLSERANILTVDFWHFSEYLAKAANAMFPKKGQREEKEAWLEDALHNAKHKKGAVSRLLKEMEDFSEFGKVSSKDKKDLCSAITYLKNHKEKMQYYKNTEMNMPIGSGVTESACKSLVKNRMCMGAARWKDNGATVVLTLRSLHITHGRWSQFWNKYSQYGYSVAA
jgi:hypothetical protein